jgi:glucose-6-phosphate isomerase
MHEVSAAGGLTVRVAHPPHDVYEALLAAQAPARLAAKDATLWGPTPSPRRRSGWAGSTPSRHSRALVPQLAELRDELSDLDHVVLAGMGGSSLAPEVITRTMDRPLTVLDTTDPGQVRAALADRLERTVVVVASKSGSTVETDSHSASTGRRSSTPACRPTRPDGISSSSPTPDRRWRRPAGRWARFVVLADPDVGGRYSALTAFGLVPSASGGRRRRGAERAGGLLPRLHRSTSDNPASPSARRCPKPVSPHWSTTAAASWAWATGPSS